VKRLTGKTFDEIVKNKERDVMVLFTSSGCELCTVFGKTYSKVGETFKDTRNLDFATIDMSKNDVEGLTIAYFPQVLFYPAGDKKMGLEYDSGTDHQQVVDFVKKKATVPLFEEFTNQDVVKEDL
jgi:hypothetical protein